MSGASLQLLLEGLVVTLELCAAAAVLATVLGLLAGLGRMSLDPIVRAVSRIYVEVFRGTSILVQLFWFYFALPLLFGIELPAMAAGILVLGLNIGAYGAEVVRGAIEDVPPGQHEAAIALHLTRWQRMRHVIVPQALPAMLPPAGNLLIELVKASSVVSMITIGDLTYAANRIREHTLQTSLVYGVVLLVYFAIAQVIMVGIRRLERRLRHG
jgi:polar amino acid transport system permease protein